MRQYLLMETKKMDITELYKKQISITEWFENIKHGKTEQLRAEDNAKRDRLKILNTIIDLPFDKPHSFMANEIVKETFEFKQFLREHGKELCALRLMPLDSTLPKLRMRGKTVKESILWFKEQTIDPALYKADFVPHPETPLWSSIFIVNNKGIFGELIRGGHHQLTQGFHEQTKPIAFSFHSNGWNIEEGNSEAREHAQQLVNFIKVNDSTKRWMLGGQLGTTFYGDYMKGYFETVQSKEFGIWFIDYNLTLAELYHDFKPLAVSSSLVKGQPVSRGNVKGQVKLVTSDNLDVDIHEGHILVCEMTTPDYFVLMQKAGGIITDGGGMLSHASIVARELGKPCIVGTGNATNVLKDGEWIELDADTGNVKRI
jgi:phosphoenolpyruvate synthase/pyruvate phosphate dikinase